MHSHTGNASKLRHANENGEPIAAIVNVKDGGKALATRVSMSGVPHHALESRLAMLIEAGLSLAIADQLTIVQRGQALVERKVTRVLTPRILADANYFRLESLIFSPPSAPRTTVISLQSRRRVDW